MMQKIDFCIEYHRWTANSPVQVTRLILLSSHRDHINANMSQWFRSSFVPMELESLLVSWWNEEDYLQMWSEPESLTRHRHNSTSSYSTDSSPICWHDRIVRTESICHTRVRFFTTNCETHQHQWVGYFDNCENLFNYHGSCHHKSSFSSNLRNYLTDNTTRNDCEPHRVPTEQQQHLQDE